MLDIFHAVKRISDKISKRHSLRAPCMEELKAVFRDPMDKGPLKQKLLQSQVSELYAHAVI